jgi:hypothetical protein
MPPSLEGDLEQERMQEFFPLRVLIEQLELRRQGHHLSAFETFFDILIHNCSLSLTAALLSQTKRKEEQEQRFRRKKVKTRWRHCLTLSTFSIYNPVGINPVSRSTERRLLISLSIDSLTPGY